jgi:hypothetical protein
MNTMQAQKRFFSNNNTFERGIFHSIENEHPNMSSYDADLIRVSNLPRVHQWPNMQGLQENRLGDVDEQSLYARQKRA